MLEFFVQFQENIVHLVDLYPFGPVTVDASVFTGQLNRKYWTHFLLYHLLSGQESTDELSESDWKCTVKGSLIRGMESDLGCIQMPFLEHQVNSSKYGGLPLELQNKNQDTKSVKNGLAFVSSNRCFSALGMSPGFNGDETKVWVSLIFKSYYTLTV